MGQQGVFQALIDADLVGILAARAGPRDIARLDQVGNDPLDGPLSDTDLLGKLAHGERRATSNCQEDVAVVGQKGPIGRRTAASNGPDWRVMFGRGTHVGSPDSVLAGRLLVRVGQRNLRLLHNRGDGHAEFLVDTLCRGGSPKPIEADEPA
jgi:hypothetical protein